MCKRQSLLSNMDTLTSAFTIHHTETVTLSPHSPNLKTSRLPIGLAIASFGTNPSNGADGWEDSGKGRYKDGKPDYSRMPRDHNEHYPLWAPRNSTLKRGPAGPAQRFENSRPEPCQPKCGCPCKPNRDPGCAPGAYGSYHPAPALEYFAPKDWEGDCNDNDLK
ncbi:hypothetical protein H4Q26_016756 [Puccinia striiformis f. sp. tritici PST-130]|nr:hypothetical protein H4Q26_016756 [Puccinia striiformis f. sp. tritici PST-130]